MDNVHYLQPSILFTKLTKVADFLPVWLSKDVYFLFYIDLVSDKDDGTILPVREYHYNKGDDFRVSVKRKFIPYLAFDYPDEYAPYGKGQLRIYSDNIISMQETFDGIRRSMSKLSAFKTIKNKLKVVDPFHANVTLNGRGILEFTPTVIINQDDNTDIKPGLLMNINGRCNVSVPLNTFDAMLHIVKCADYYGWGSTLASPYTSMHFGSNPILVGDKNKFNNKKIYGNEKINLMEDEVNDVKITNRSNKNKIKSFFED